MTTLREAAQQALEAMEGELPDWRTPAQARAITALRDALAQEEQPKIAPAPGWCKHCRQYTVEEPLLAQEEQEPVLVVEQEPDYMSRGHFYEGSKSFIDPTEVWKLPIGTKLYTHPPRREWQGLTTQEAMALTDTAPKGVFYGCDAGTGLGIWIAAVAAAERALKERNHG